MGREPAGDVGGSQEQVQGAPHAALTDVELVAALVRSPRTAEVWRFFVSRVMAVVARALHHRVLRAEPVHAAAWDAPVLTPAEQAHLRADEAERKDLVDDATLHYVEFICARITTERSWRADGGAGLDTYIVNGAVMSFADRVKRWRTMRGRETTADVVAFLDHRAAPAPDGPEDVLMAALDKERLLAEMMRLDPVATRAVLRRFDTGASWQVIAGEVGLSPKVLRTRRRALRDRLDGWGRFA